MHRLVLLSLLSIPLAACGGYEPGEGPSADDARELCERSCTRELACDDGSDQTVAACTAECTPYVRNYRADALEEMVECLEDHTCRQIEEEDVCDAVIEELTPTAEATAFVQACTAASDRCTQFDFPCGSPFVKLFNDEVLADLRACTSQPCAQIDACFERALPDF